MKINLEKFYKNDKWDIYRYLGENFHKEVKHGYDNYYDLEVIFTFDDEGRYIFLHCYYQYDYDEWKFEFFNGAIKDFRKMDEEKLIAMFEHFTCIE